MCNHYKIEGIRFSAAEFASLFPEDGPLYDIFPSRFAPVVIVDEGGLVRATMRWGFPPPSGSRPVTNVRNTASPFWRPWLLPEQRCLVPFTAFAEWTADPPKREVWFEPVQDGPTAFAGIWRPVGNEIVFAFLTCAPNREVAEVHPKAMPVVLRGDEMSAWLALPTKEALQLQRPLPDGSLRVVNA